MKCKYCNTEFIQTRKDNVLCSDKCKNNYKYHRTKHTDKYKEYNRNRVKKYIYSKYNLTIDGYNQLLIEQNGCCKICGRHQTKLKKKLVVDHCHRTGKVRGLLCYNCNLGIGLLFDNQTILQSAINYLNN